MTTATKDIKDITKPYQYLPNFQYERNSDGSEYTGQIIGGKKSGKGRMFWSKSHFYDGSWKDDKYHGNGIYYDTDGNRYEGEFVEGKYQGHGTLFYANQCYYKGDFVDGKKHGNGTETYPNGSVYTGQFQNNSCEGQGILVRGEYSYEGSFKAGKREGQGTEFYRNSKYEGDFVNGQRHGKGEWTKYDGSWYRGTWFMGQKHGYGVEFSNKVLLDQNKESGSRLETYEGEFVQGFRHGFGRLTFSDESSYYGYWSKGKRHGKFLYIENDEHYQVEYDFGEPIEEKVKIDEPDSEIKGYRDIIEETIFKQEEKVEDPDFLCDETALTGSSNIKIDPDDVEWRTIHEYLGDFDYYLFSNNPADLVIQPSKFSNFMVLTILSGFFEMPTHLSRIFSPHYNKDLGFYIMKIFQDGRWKEIFLDDRIPIFKDKGIPITATIKDDDKQIGILLIEKLFAKLHKGYLQHLHNQLSVNTVLEYLTGYVPIKIKTDNMEICWKEFVQYHDFRIMYAKPKKQFADAKKLATGYLYPIVGLIPRETKDKSQQYGIIQLKALEKYDVEKTPSQEVKNLVDYYHKKHKIESTENPLKFWMDFTKFCEYFDEILVVPTQENHHHHSFHKESKLSYGSTIRHEMRYFEFEVPFQLNISLYVTQQLYKDQKKHQSEYESQDEDDTMGLDAFPMRLILTKYNKPNQFEYIYGKGQITEKTLHRNLMLDKGKYVLCVHIEYPKDYDHVYPLALTVALESPILLNLFKDTPQIHQFFNKAYASCAEKYGDKTDLSKFQNGSKELIFYEHFKKHDGVFVQYFQNKTDHIRWRYSANFTLTNMKILGLPDHKQQTEIIIDPKKTHTLLIMQTEGKPYVFLGGQGSLNLEEIKHKNKKY